MDLVEITRPEFDVDFEIVYAGADNFTGKPVYRGNMRWAWKR